MPMNPFVQAVTERIQERSRESRQAYLDKINAAMSDGGPRKQLSCSNLAHGIAANTAAEKKALAKSETANIAIVSAYNDMLSAHQPLEGYPALIKAEARAHGAVAQFAGGVPAMCDGVTQGQDGMDLSLFSRDVIALSTAVALSHNMFDATLCLGVCDKIVPGLLIGALAYGHLPTVFVPAGPMVSGLANKQKAKIREQYAAGEIGRAELLQAESAAYHGVGTCTFYGTANTNQMMLEFMGLQLPGGSFVNPGTPLRDALTKAAVERVLALTAVDGRYRPIGHIVTAKAIVNALVGLLATGGSTNHTLHIVAIAAAAGIRIDWNDFAELSAVVPLLARVYPNGTADVNHFHAAGGLAFVMRELLTDGLLHDDVLTVAGDTLSEFNLEPSLVAGELAWQAAPAESLDEEIVRPASAAFADNGGINLVAGNLGRAIVKVSAVAEEHRQIEAPARVFTSQHDFTNAYNAKELDGDFVAVIAWQGPSANGMPELHKLTPYLGVLQNRGHRVALLTDGRMSGASGKILAAIQVTPEANRNGPIRLIRDGDIIRIDANKGEMSLLASDDSWQQRSFDTPDLTPQHRGLGRELFASFRLAVGNAEDGASIFDEA
ncbi:MAG: phosphogluconate dehydratase [Pseudomonadota bacterium]